MGDYDHFEDFLEGEEGVREGGGILDSQGLRDFEGISTTVQKEGASVLLNCRMCNKKKSVVIEWPELVILGENVPGQAPLLPQGWQFSAANGTAYVQMRCPNCGNDKGFAVHLAPDEARSHVQAGLNSGLVRPDVVQGVRQQVLRAKASGAR